MGRLLPFVLLSACVLLPGAGNDPGPRAPAPAVEPAAPAPAKPAPAAPATPAPPKVSAAPREVEDAIYPVPDVAVWIDAGAHRPSDAARLIEALPGFTQLYPVMYNLEPTGKLTRVASPATARLLAEAHLRGIRILPTVQNVGPGGFDGTRVRKVLADPELRGRHLVDLVAAAQADGGVGLNLDYESLEPADRPALASFLAMLRRVMQKRGLTLSVCVPARTEAEPGWDGAKIFDWRQLPDLADEVAVMAYDFHWPGGEPGPVAPVGWVEATARWALRHLPAGRIRMGVPLYGYDWGGERTENVAQRDLAALALRAGITWRDLGRGARVSGFLVGETAAGSYVDAAGRTHQVYVDSSAATREKLRTFEALGIHRVAFWRGEYADDALLAALAVSR